MFVAFGSSVGRVSLPKLLTFSGLARPPSPSLGWSLLVVKILTRLLTPSGTVILALTTSFLHHFVLFSVPSFPSFHTSSVPSYTTTSFPSFFLPSFLPYFLPSFHTSSLPSYIALFSCFPLFLPTTLPSIFPSFLKYFLPSFLHYVISFTYLRFLPAIHSSPMCSSLPSYLTSYPTVFLSSFLTILPPFLPTILPFLQCSFFPPYIRVVVSRNKSTSEKVYIHVF